MTERANDSQEEQKYSFDEININNNCGSYELPRSTSQLFRDEKSNCVFYNFYSHNELDDSVGRNNNSNDDKNSSRNWTNIFKNCSLNQERESSHDRTNIFKLRDLVAKKEYPISVIEIDESEESAKSAIEYIVQLIQFSSSSNQ